MNVSAAESGITNVEAWNDAFAREHDIDEYYASAPGLIRFVERRRLRWIERMIAAEPTDRILEVGCGGGHVLRLFPQADLTGVEVSGRMIEKAARNLMGYRVRLLKGELHELGLPDGGFDKIICTEVLEHVADPESILAEMSRLLRPGGRAVITFPNDRLIHWIKGIFVRTGVAGWPGMRRISWGGDEFHIHVWRTSEMHALLSRFFRVLRLGYAPFRWMPIRCCFLCTSRNA